MNESPYISITLSSGLQAAVRPRTYKDWVAQEKARLERLRLIADLPEKESAIALQELGIELREQRLQAWVRDFESISTAASLKEIAELEGLAFKLEEMEIPLGNSEPGTPGQ